MPLWEGEYGECIVTEDFEVLRGDEFMRILKNETIIVLREWEKVHGDSCMIALLDGDEVLVFEENYDKLEFQEGK